MTQVLNVAAAGQLRRGRYLHVRVGLGLFIRGAISRRYRQGLALAPAPSGETHARNEESRTCVPARPVGAEITLGAPAISWISASSLRAGSMFTSALLSYLQRSTDPVPSRGSSQQGRQHGTHSGK